MIVICDVVSDIGSDSSATGEAIIAFWGWRPDAITANIDWLTSMLQVVSNVLLT
jgi:hypothetical protein